ncbi:carboxylesterase/lipase family protein [Streptomyces sp. NPDC090088]|uniref:carboxylesterase/lipase family protein n=1 Tax=Streptomyces sp. NPDC090088 TaxID=3365944 RepID=UPI0037FA9CA7
MKYIRRFGALLGLVLLLSTTACATQKTTSPGQVDAPDGTFVGKTTDTGRQFLGIRYAQPPVGPLRWAAPKPVSATHQRYVAKKFGSDCVQPVNGWNFNPKPGDSMRGSEDCLFLNVYSPREDTHPKPVMVWIHGGGFVTGAGRDYDPHILAERHDAIVVTINYRLGALGFLSHPALGRESGNFGLLDQQMALQWVQRNIAAFGGDRSRVTIFGESAGGVSVCGHLRAPGSKGLFTRAIDESGPCAGIPRKVADQRGESYARAAKCPSTGQEALRCLRSIPARTVAANPPGDIAAGDTPWTLVSDTAVLPHNLDRKDGALNRVPVINGSNGDEGRLFAQAALPLLRTEADYKKNVQTQFGPKAKEVMAQYPVRNYASPALAYADYMTDFLFACPAFQADTALSQQMPVYGYEFNERTGNYWKPAPKEIPSLGAHHAKEIQFIFQTPSFFGGPADLTAKQKRLSDQMMQAWASFARDGVPAIHGQAPWKPVRQGKVLIRNLDTRGPTSVGDFAEQHKCGFWSSLPTPG